MIVKCTILVPTYNRPHYLKRILDYYNDSNQRNRFQFIVGDSSHFNERKENKQIVQSFAGLHITYIDNYSEKLNSLQKFADMVQKVKTRFCVFCADDDFVTPDGIMEAVDFLDKNKDYAVAHGHYVRFYLSKGKIKPHFAWAPRYPAYSSIAYADAKSRLTFHLSNYNVPTTYAVHRTTELKKAYREFIKSGVDPWLFGEILPSVLTLIYGKMKKLDVFHSARDSSTFKGAKWPSLVDFIENGTYAKNYAKFRKCLAQNLSKTGKIKLKEAEKTVDDAMALYIARCYAERKNKTGKLGKIFNALGLPDGLDEGFRKIYRKISAKKELKSDAFWESLDNHASAAAKELEAVKKCVLEHA
jgi:glycosyltransferase domain-containing protein